MTANRPALASGAFGVGFAVVSKAETCFQSGWRSWKGFDWAATNHLHQKGFISDPVGNAKSVVMTEDGLERSKALFRATSAKTV